jgi:hypothetical protein
MYQYLLKLIMQKGRLNHFSQINDQALHPY